ncbi:MAG TPA: hypothetical protein VF490_07165, partial [Chryseosolibacter sp.]
KKLDVYQVTFPGEGTRDQAHDFSTSSSSPFAAPGKWLKRTINNAAMIKKLKWIQSARNAGAIVICENYPEALLHLPAGTGQSGTRNRSASVWAVPDLICRISGNVESGPETLPAPKGEGIIQGGGRGRTPRIIVADSGTPANALLPLLTKEIWNLL